MVVWVFLKVPWVCLRFMIVVFPDHTHLLFTVCESKLVLILVVPDKIFTCERLYISQLVKSICVQ